MTRSYVLLAFVGQVGAASAAVPSFVPFQGVVTGSGGAPVSESIEVELELFPAAVGGDPLGGGQVVNAALQGDLLEGRLEVDDALLAAISAAPAVWLEVRLGEPPEALPRQEVGSVMFALAARDAVRAQDAGALGGVPASALAAEVAGKVDVAGDTMTGPLAIVHDEVGEAGLRVQGGFHASSGAGDGQFFWHILGTTFGGGAGKAASGMIVAAERAPSTEFSFLRGVANYTVQDPGGGVVAFELGGAGNAYFRGHVGVGEGKEQAAQALDVAGSIAYSGALLGPTWLDVSGATGCIDDFNTTQVSAVKRCAAIGKRCMMVVSGGSGDQKVPPHWGAYSAPQSGWGGVFPCSMNLGSGCAQTWPSGTYALCL